MKDKKETTQKFLDQFKLAAELMVEKSMVDGELDHALLAAYVLNFADETGFFLELEVLEDECKINILGIKKVSDLEKAEDEVKTSH